MQVKLTLDDFIRRARAVHGDKYDYSKVVFKGSHKKVCIVCPTHGEFWQVAKSHWSGIGCAACSGNVKLSTEQFIERAKKIHGNRYDYSESQYKNMNEKVRIKCLQHGLFEQVASSHLSGHGCPYCSDSVLLTNEEFVKRAKKVHGDKYDYILVDYKGARIKVLIKCKSCNAIFKLDPNGHLSGQGCPQCGIRQRNESIRLPYDIWVARARKNHTTLYDYSEVQYNKLLDKVKIGCPKHGFFYQEAKAHMEGTDCPLCSQPSRGENLIEHILTQNDIEHIRQYAVYNESILCDNIRLIVDFFLPKYNMFIEYNGRQHYMPVKRFGGESDFEQQKERDIALRLYCKEHKIKLLEIPYTEYREIGDILKKELKIKTT